MSDSAAEGCDPSWKDHAAGAASSASLTALAGVVPGELTGAQLVDAITASEKALSFLSAMQMRLFAAFGQPFVAGDPMRLATRLARKNRMHGDPTDEQIQFLVPDAAISLAATEVAAALRISPVTAGIRVREAMTMTTALAPTLEALEQGKLDRGKARVIAEQCEPLDVEHVASVQKIVLPSAENVSTSELREITGQAVITVDPDGADERHQQTAARRSLALKALPDAMATLTAFLPADGAVKIFQVSDLLATSAAGGAGDPRGIGARRVDALVDIADHLLTHGYLDLTELLGGQTVSDDEDADETDAAPSADSTVSAGESAATDCRTAGPDNIRPDAAESPTAGVDFHPTVADHALIPEDTGTVDTHPGATVAEGAQVDDNTTISRDLNLPTADEPATSDVDSADTPTSVVEVRSSGSSEEADVSPSNRPSSRSTATRTPADGSPRRRPDQAGRTFKRQGRRPHLSVTMGWETLAGLNDLPGMLAGYGAIPPGLSRSIAASAATITTQIVDAASGVVTHAGSLTYRPSQELRDRISALMTTCQFPSCRQPVWRCDIDHRNPFDHSDPENGGPTDAENTGPLCRRHHLIKHHTDWQMRPDPERFILSFTSPTGHRYTKHGRQAAPPTMWLENAGSGFADCLDTIMIGRKSEDPSEAPSAVEDRLSTLLLRRHLNPPKIEYVPIDSFWGQTDLGPPTSGDEPSVEPRRGEEHNAGVGLRDGASKSGDTTVEAGDTAGRSNDSSGESGDGPEEPPPF